MPRKWTRSNLLTEKMFLRVQERARRISGIKIVSIQWENDTIFIRCNSATVPGKIWKQEIKFISEEELSGIRGNKIRKGNARMAKQVKNEMTYDNRQPFLARAVYKQMLDSPIKVFCDCPAFLYWGYKYIAWHKGYGIYPEHRSPRIRNPHKRGYLCKHLFAILTIWQLLMKTVTARANRDALLKATGSTRMKWTHVDADGNPIVRKGNKWVPAVEVNGKLVPADSVENK